MALSTEDILVDISDGWLALVVTGTVIHITSIKRSPILFRLDIASTSNGTEMFSGDTLSSNETVYVKNLKSEYAVIVVTKD